LLSPREQTSIYKGYGSFAPVTTKALLLSAKNNFLFLSTSKRSFEGCGLKIALPLP